MKSFCLLVSMMLAHAAFGQNYNIAFVSKLEYPGQTLANIWGFAANGKEYALVGAEDGMSIVDVTDPTNPTELEQITDGISSLWREIKTYGNYAYVTTEGVDNQNTSGLGIADLTNLPNVPVPFHKYTGDGPINGTLKRIHALDVDEAKGYVYLYGADAISQKGIICLNLLPDPYNPTYAGQYNVNYVHDGYSNNDIVYGSHIFAGYFSIIDFSNKSNPVVLATQATPNTFTHNTWISSDGNHLYTTDEKPNSYLTVYNIDDVNDIYETDKIRTTPNSGSIVHNTYAFNNHTVSSWYKDGVTITDVSRPSNIIQTGAYDTYPSGSGNGFEGAWGVYPYLPSGNLLVTNMEESLSGGGTGGVLYILSPTYPDACYLEGKVTDVTTGNAIFGAYIEIDHTDPLNETNSDVAGNYATGQPTSGTFDVTISADLYTSQTFSVTLNPGAVTVLDAQLQRLALPVELVGFTGTALKSSNLLEWTTASEVNVEKFEIQRQSELQGNWESIGYVDATGNSAVKTDYRFIDGSPYIESFYRLKSIDLDGRVEYSKVIEVNRPVDRFAIKNTYPVPSSGMVLLEILSEKESNAQVTVFGLSGNKVMETNLELETGLNKSTFEFPQEAPSGIYLIQLVSGNEMRKASVVLRR